MRNFLISMLLVYTAGAVAEFDVRIISYNQFLGLSQPKRVRYLKELRELLVLMEKQQAGREVADNGPTVEDLREQIAWIMDAMAFLPKASADDETPVAAPQAAPGCEKPTFDCAKYDDPALKAKLEKDFRADRQNKECIYGGFFSTYSSPQKRAGTCRPVLKIDGFAKKCSTGQAMCNPWLYCLSVTGKHKYRGEDGKEATKDVTITLEPNCIAANKRSGFNVTERCDQWYTEKLAKKDTEDFEGQKLTVEACDPLKVTKENNPAAEAWEKIREGMYQKYRKQCVQTESFLAMFCNECKLMADRLYAANTGAFKTACPPADAAGEQRSTVTQ